MLSRVTKKSIAFLVIAMVLIPAARYLYRFHHVKEYFWALQRGTSRQEIVRELGNPSTSEACGENLWWGDDGNFLGKNQGECVEWIRYDFILEAWAFGFSKDGRVVSKYHYVSE